MISEANDINISGLNAELDLIMKKKPKLNVEDGSFGRHLARIRKSRGLTQKELAEHIGLTRRMVAYYEAESEHIPTGLLPSIAKVLRVSADQLLGLKDIKIKAPEISMKLQSKLNIIPKLPHKERKAVLDYAQALYTSKKHTDSSRKS